MRPPDHAWGVAPEDRTSVEVDEISIVPGCDRVDLHHVTVSVQRATAVRRGRELEEAGKTRGLKELKRDIELNRYDVDSGAVADAILSKLRLVRQARLALADEPVGRTPQATARFRHPAA